MGTPLFTTSTRVTWSGYSSRGARSSRCRPEHRADKCVSSPIALPTGAAQFLRCHLPSGQAVAAETAHAVRYDLPTERPCAAEMWHMPFCKHGQCRPAGAAEMRRTVQISECTGQTSSDVTN